MARKNVLHTPIATAQSLAASFNSAATVVTFLDNIAYQINITTSNSQGTFAVQGSLDYSVNEANNVVNSGSWANLQLSGGTPTVAAANDTILIDLNQLPYKAIRLAYTSSVAGTGHCDIILQARQLGG